MKRAERLTSIYACNGVAHPLEVSTGIAQFSPGFVLDGPAYYFDIRPPYSKAAILLRYALHDLFGTMADEGRAFKTFLRGKLTCAT